MVASGKGSWITGGQEWVRDLFFMDSLLFIWILSHAIVFPIQKLINHISSDLSDPSSMSS